MKYPKRIYWITTLITVGWMLSGSIGALSNAPFMVEAMQTLGYPGYFHYPLGIAKLVGVILLLAPVPPLYRLWAYAGVVFELLAATISYAWSGMLLPDSLFPLGFLTIVLVSLISWLKKENIDRLLLNNGNHHRRPSVRQK